MDYSAISQAAKRFEQENKVNHKVGESKHKIIATLREDWMSNIEPYPKSSQFSP